MSSVWPVLDHRIAEIAPGFRAVSITVRAAPITRPAVAAEALADACKSFSAGFPSWGESHLAAWAEVFRTFGAKPQRTPCSAEALRKRVVRDGNLSSIDPVVDLYNAISIKYAIPVGGENYAAYVGAPRLTIAEGTERFDTVKEGTPAFESPEKGEVIWRDDLGVTCRRWNWRQGVRTRLDASAQRMWFILESLPVMPIWALNEAADQLIAGLALLLPGSEIESTLVDLTIL